MFVRERADTGVGWGSHSTVELRFGGYPRCERNNWASIVSDKLTLYGEWRKQ